MAEAVTSLPTYTQWHVAIGYTGIALGAVTLGVRVLELVIALAVRSAYLRRVALTPTVRARLASFIGFHGTFGQLYLAAYIAMPLTANWIWPRLGTPISIVWLIMSCFVSLFLGVFFIRVYLAVNASLFAAQRVDADRRGLAADSHGESSTDAEARSLQGLAEATDDSKPASDDRRRNSDNTSALLRVTVQPYAAAASTSASAAEPSTTSADSPPSSFTEPVLSLGTEPSSARSRDSKQRRSARFGWLVYLHAFCMFFSWVSLIGASVAFSSNARVNGFPYKQLASDPPEDAGVADMLVGRCVGRNLNDSSLPTWLVEWDCGLGPMCNTSAAGGPNPYASQWPQQ